MSIETAPTKSSPDSKWVAVKAESPKPATVATPIEKPKDSGKNTAAPADPQPKLEGLAILLKELESPDSARRATAAGALGRTADVAAVPALIAALGDADADVAREAAASLGLLHHAAAVEPLIAVLDDRDGYFHGVVRTAAIHSLGQLGDVRAVVPLLNAIKDPIAEASAEAIRALVLLSDPRTLPALLEVVRNKHGFFLNTTRHAAILGLAKVGGEQASCELRFVAGNQWEDAVIRAAAIEATRQGATASA